MPTRDPVSTRTRRTLQRGSRRGDTPTNTTRGSRPRRNTQAPGARAGVIRRRLVEGRRSFRLTAWSVTAPTAGDKVREPSGLPHAPADLTHHFHRAPGDGDAYLFWRVSEGGQVEPFRSMQSVMPAFKTVLSEDERWDVLAYVHVTFHGGFLPKSVTGEGTVIAVVPASEELVVKHGDIKGFMGPMTMGYRVKPPSLLKPLKAGDSVRFTIDTEEKAIVTIQKLKK